MLGFLCLPWAGKTGTVKKKRRNKEVGTKEVGTVRQNVEFENQHQDNDGQTKWRV
jgi:hypothetical protein